ncbi:MAG: reverse transcriptase domain-containing protein [Candidatus Coatesbacteria bacterium]
MTATARALPPLDRPLLWGRLYREAELLKAALRVYTKPLFAWRKALAVSTDDRTLYDFARSGLKHLDRMHGELARGEFRFRPGLALTFNFNGKRRTLHIYPWEERVVDLLLYRLLTRSLHGWLSPHAWAYRITGFGVDRCQRGVAKALQRGGGPRYVVKRDITEYFASVDHGILLEQVGSLVAPGDPLMRLLESRVRFQYRRDGETLTADRGIPFGTAVACAFANIHLTGLDRDLAAIPGIAYFRYADDILVVTPDGPAARRAASVIDDALASLRLTDKASHRHDYYFAAPPGPRTDPPREAFGFAGVSRFRHLGLEYRADGSIGLSRDKFRKIMNLFRYAFRRKAKRLARMKDPEARARTAVELARQVLENGMRNIAIVDYYLKHVTDEAQLGLLDRWLAEEVLAIATGRGHRKGNFRVISYGRLRALGLPSLVHRRRLIRHGHLDSSFFIWKIQQARRAAGRTEGTAATPGKGPQGPLRRGFSPSPEAAAIETPVGEGAACRWVSLKNAAATRQHSFPKPSFPLVTAAHTSQEDPR